MTHTAASIAEAVGAELLGPPETRIAVALPLAEAGPDAIAFLRDEKFLSALPESRAGAVLVNRGLDLANHANGRSILLVDDADRALVSVLTMLAPPPPAREPGVHPTSIVDPSASVAASAHVGPWCIIGPSAKIGEGTVLLGNVTIGAHAEIGAGCTLHHGVRFLDRCVCGNACEIHANAVIGADGFGYIPDPDTGLRKVPQIGNVVIGHAVEIGACSCIDRAKFGSTRVGDGSKLDNLVQVGHNCNIGRCCVLCGQVALGGTTTIGDGAMLGGQVGVKDNLTIGAGAQIGAQSGITAHIEPGARVFGTPAEDIKKRAARLATLRKLPARVDRLEKNE